MIRWVAVLLLCVFAAGAHATDMMLTGVGDRAAAAGGGPFFLVQEDGTSKFLLEDTPSQVVFDAASTASSGAPGTTLTWSHTSSGSNRGLIAGVAWVGADPAATATYNGVAMTSLGAVVADFQNDFFAQQFSLIAPDTSAHNVVVTFSPAPEVVVAGAVSYTGAHQTTLTGTQVSDVAGGGGTIDVVASSASGEIVQDVVAGADSATLTVGAGQTSRWNDTTLSIVGAGSTEPGAASVTMSWTGSSGNGIIAAVAVKPAAGAPSTFAILLE